MILTNYHSHSTFSDGVSTPEEMVLSAIEHGFSIFGLSDHAIAPGYESWCMRANTVENYIQILNSLKEKYKEKIIFLSGLEMDYILNKDNWDDLIEYGLDYVVGSVHFLNKEYNDKYIGFDASPEEFMLGLKEVYKSDVKKMVHDYYENIINMVSSKKPNIIGHIDLIKKFNRKLNFLDETQHWYREILETTIKTISKNESILEVNTSAKYKRYSDEYYPSNWVLELALKYNLKIMINTDAHSSGLINSEYANAVNILKNIGFTELSYIDKFGKIKNQLIA